MQRIAFFTPLSPSPTGIADYSAALLPHLAAHVEIDVFADGDARSVSHVPPGLPVFAAAEFPRRVPDRRYDAVVYQIGNSPYHRDGYAMLLRHPGVTVLHDLVLHHFYVERTLEHGDTAGYVREMAYAAGYAGAMMAGAAMRGDQAYPRYAMPLWERVVDASHVVLVHNAFMKERIRASRPAANVAIAPMICHPDARQADPTLTARLRERWEVPVGAPVVACFGGQDVSKRCEAVLDAVARLRAEIPSLRCLFVGVPVPGYDLAALIRARGLQDAALVTGRVPLNEFFAAFDLADVAVNLRHPTAGETSATAIQLLCRGVPLVVSDIAAYAELPDEVAIKLSPGAKETGQLVQALRAILTSSVLSADMRAAAKAHGATAYATERVTAAYLDAIDRAVHLAGRTRSIRAA